MSDNAVGYIYSDKGHIEFVSYHDISAPLTFTNENGDFEYRFKSWQLRQHKEGNDVTINISCSGIPYRIALETRFVIERGGKSVELGAKVEFRAFGDHDFSLMSIGVRPESYQFFKM